MSFGPNIMVLKGTPTICTGAPQPGHLRFESFLIVSLEMDGALTLDLRTKRSELKADRARALLNDVLDGRRTDYTRLILSDYAWTPEAAEVAAEAIMKLPLKDAIISDIIASKPEADGLAGELYRAENCVSLITISAVVQCTALLGLRCVRSS